jgi:hypothetical protein
LKVLSNQVELKFHKSTPSSPRYRPSTSVVIRKAQERLRKQLWVESERRNEMKLKNDSLLFKNKKVKEIMQKMILI